MTEDGKKAILLVEDDQFLCDLLVDKLKESGFEVTIAKDAEAALGQAKAHTPDLILLDLILPGMDGFEFIAKLREEPAAARVPFIVLSNSAETANKQEAERMGAEAYLVKAQVTPAEIVEAILALFKAPAPAQ